MLGIVEWIPAGGDALRLRGPWLAIAVGCNFLLGALMTLGVGLYAPCLILVSLLGMNPIAAFPIMMGSCAFLMPVAGLRFIAAQRYDARAALGLALGGIPGVLIAAFIVKQLPLLWLRWLVVAVVLYTAIAMLRSARALRPRRPGNYFFFARVRLRPGAGGTLPPARRASDRPIAIACLRLVTFLPVLPLRNVPSLRSCIARFTFCSAFFPYRFAIWTSSCAAHHARRRHRGAVG